MLTKSEKPELKQELQRRTSRLAIVSSICLITALLLVLLFTWTGVVIFDVIASALFPVSFILGVTAFVLITKTNELKGYFYTIAPISIGFVITAVMFLIDSNAVTGRNYEKSHVTQYNLKLLGKAIGKYAKNHNGYLPNANQWCDLLIEHDPNITKKNFKRPKIIEGECNLAFNKNLSGLRLSDVPRDIVLLFEADGDWNLNGSKELIETRRSEHGYVYLLYADQSIWTHWFYEDGVRNNITYEYEHKPPRWKP